MNLYFDTAATTYVCEDSIAAMTRFLRDEYGNPSSLHGKGMQVEQAVVEAKKFFAKTLGVNDKELYFTSGGTESNNLALLGSAKAYQRNGKHIITTGFEHPSVGSPLAALVDEGFEVTRIHPDRTGGISVDEIINAVRPDTILVSIMQVNNEIGMIQPIEEIGNRLKEKKPDILFHVDGVQGFMKFDLNLKRGKVDLYTVSSHKIYGPKGCGLLYIKQNLKIKPLFFGGSQQGGIRPGTENVPGIIGFYAAAKRIEGSKEERFKTVSGLKKILYASVQDRLPAWTFNSGVTVEAYNDPKWSPYIISLRSRSIKGEVVLHALEDYKIQVSTGSACSSKKLNISHVLKSIGLKDEESDRTIRISINHEQQEEDIFYLVDALVKIDEMYGRFTKK